MKTLPTLQPGDRLLLLRRNWFSRAIAWWLSSEWSHVAPVTNPTDCLEASWPNVRRSEIANYLDGRYTVAVLRPRMPLTAVQVNAWLRTGDSLIGIQYDIRSFWGFLTGRGEQSGGRVNCTEVLLAMDQAAGLLTDRSSLLVSPQSYAEFAAAGLFDVIWRSA
jgi:hypothetical protein